MKKIFILFTNFIFSMTIYGQNIQTITYENWINNSWQYSIKQNYNYDGNGYQVSNLQQSWDINSASWKNIGLTTYTNNSNGTIQQYLSQTWDSPTSTWKNSSRADYSYTANNLVTITYQNWTNNSWQYSIKQNYTYDGNGYQVSNLQQTWDINSASWKNIGLTTYTNNSNGTIQQYLSQTWDSPTSTWKNSSRADYSYTANNLATITYQNWTNNSWQYSIKQNYTYDGNGYQVSNLQQSWNISSASWKNIGLTTYTNNNNGTIQQYLSQTWDNPTSTWKNSSRANYIYTGSTGFFESDELEFKIFPNPCTDKLSIQLNDIAKTKYSIIDKLGNIIFVNTFSNNTHIDLKELPPSTYLISLEQKGKKGLYKFIKLD